MSVFDTFTPDPHRFDPDDKKKYLLMVYTRQPFVPLAISVNAAALSRNPVFPQKTGVYGLYLNDQPLVDALGPTRVMSPLSRSALSKLKLQFVYVGKTSSDGTVDSRLQKHFNKISKRQNISVDRMVCRFMEIPENWNVLFAEETLIKTFNPPWNGQGFGSNAPGGGRPGLRDPKAKHFDVLYPMRIGVTPDPDEIDGEE